MKSYSQNGEDKIVYDYFDGYIGTVLEIGANDGKTFSNSLALIEQGWHAVLFEPGHTYRDLYELHKSNHERVHTYNFGIGKRPGRSKFWQSGSHVKNGTDTGLVSTTDFKETVRWSNQGVQFKEVDIELVTFDWVNAIYQQFDFISIDVEGKDWEVLKQIDLIDTGCKCLCVEWNSNRDLGYLFTSYANNYGFRLIHKNAENMIFAI